MIKLQDYLEGIDKVNEIMSKIDEINQVLTFNLNGREMYVESSEAFYGELCFASAFEGKEHKDIEQIKEDLKDITFAENELPAFDYNGIHIHMLRIED